MLDKGTIREAVQNAVAEAFDAHVGAMHDEVVRRVQETLEPILEARTESSELLKAAIGTVESASQQADILKALLEGSTHFAGRVALFVLRGRAAVGWQARGFADNEAIKVLSLDSGSTTVGAAIAQRGVVSASLAQLDAAFYTAIGGSPGGECAMVPLVIRDKVAAVLYADAGMQGDVRLDAAAIEILTRAAGIWIELAAFRKASAPAPAPRVAEVQPTRPMTVTPPVAEQVTATTATPEPPHAASLPVPVVPAVPTRVQVVAATDQVSGSPVPGSTSAAVAERAPVIESPGPDEEIHKKARRFAKLLVDEIVLYNREKVLEGRVRHDLYQRLKDDIDKSRATYDRRYGQTPAGQHDYFSQALVSGLADHNPSLLGPGFERNA